MSGEVRWTDRFVLRPVLAAVLSLVLVLLGAVAFVRLPVRETPELQPPTVTVTTPWPGADPAIVESDVTEILEREINGIAGVRTLTSTSREGSSQIVVEFELERDLEEAANDVRARVARARRNLPDDVDEPVVDKADADTQPVMFLRLADPTKDLLALTEIADTLVRERLQTISGVSTVEIYGEQRYAMRIELDPLALAARDIDLDAVAQALGAGNVDAPGGRLEGDAVELTVRVDAGASTPEAFEQLVVAERDGALVHLGDVAHVRLGAVNERTAARADGIPSISVAVIPQAQANILEISDAVHERLPGIVDDLPEGSSLVPTYDRTDAVRSSIRDVEHTLGLAFVLVVVVIFVFLRDLRSTVVPAVAIPVSLVGTFLFLWIAGFSVNVFTLFGLVLAIGLVVDDAIVVLENVVRHLEAGLDPLNAAIVGTRQIVFAVVATTVSLVVVFLPVVFTGGTTGRLFLEFGTTVAVSVALSGVVALTLTPMLTSRLLRARPGHDRRSASAFTRIEDGFAWSLGHFARIPALAYAGVAAALVAGALGLRVLPREFLPLEDRNMFMMRVLAPEGTTFAFMNARMAELEPELMAAVPERKTLLTRVASGPGGVAAPANTGMYVMALTPKEDRARSQQEIVDGVRKELAGVTAFLVIPSQPPIVGRSFNSPLQFVLQNPDFEALARTLPEFVAKVRKIPGLSAVNEDLKLNRPELRVRVARDRAAAAGVTPRALARTLQILTSNLELSRFKRGTRSYPVLVGLAPEHRGSPDALTRIGVRTRAGGSVPLGNFVDLVEQSGASARYHFDRTPSATISANLDGITLGTAIERVEALAEAELPPGFRTSLAGESREFADSNQALVATFGLAVVLVYLTLAAQFDSFVDPVCILVSVPIALAGAFVGLAAAGMTLSFFAQVGLILLVGLVTKNGILIVEYAKQLQETEGMSRRDSALASARIRFRPVLMTSVATVVGAAPIALGFSSSSRAPLGVAVVAGMSLATVLTLYVTPVIYATLGRGIRRTPKGPLAAAAVALVWASAARAEEVTLPDALALALAHNLDLARAATTVDAAEADRANAIEDLLPTAGGAASVTRDAIGAGTAEPWQWRAVARVDQPLVVVPAWSASSAARARRDAAQADRDALVEEILAEAGARYVALVRADQELVLSRALVARSRRLADLASDRVEVGAAPAIDATRAAIVARQDELREIAASAARERARLSLAEFLGIPLDRPIPLAVAGPVAEPPADGVDRPDVIAADHAAAAAAADVRASARAAIPSLGAFAEAGIANAPTPTSGWVTVGVASSVTFGSGGYRPSDVSGARADVDDAALAAEDLRREVDAEVAAADLAVATGTRTWEIARDVRGLAELEVAQAEDRFVTGASSNVEVVEAQTRLAVATTGEVDALAAYNLALIEAWRARGRLRTLATSVGQAR